MDRIDYVSSIYQIEPKASVRLHLPGNCRGVALVWDVCEVVKGGALRTKITSFGAITCPYKRTAVQTCSRIGAHVHARISYDSRYCCETPCTLS